ncbi:hypothetical protein DV737_g5034, partial [Chaetothyriales sp. CBS 132003]
MATPTNSSTEKGPAAKPSSRQSIAASLDLGRISSEPSANRKGDIAEELYQDIDSFTPEELEAEQARVLRLIDWRIMPIICITYAIQFLDKLSLNYASAYDLVSDLGLEGNRYGWVAAIFNFGYLFWAFPANLLIQRLPVAKYTGTMILVWSILLVCHTAAKNYAGILVLRFILGMFEASISPAIMNICSMFYTRSEQPLRMCIFLSFNAKFLTHKQRVVAVHRVATNMIGVKTKQYKPAQMLEAVTDLKVIGIALVGFACGVVNGGVSNFASALIKGYGFSGIYATLLQLPTAAPGNNAANKCIVAFICIYVFGFAATWGSIGPIVTGEVPSNRLRSKSVSCALTANWFGALLVTSCVPYLINKSYANLGTKRVATRKFKSYVCTKEAAGAGVMAKAEVVELEKALKA